MSIESKMSWDEYFMRLALLVAAKSKDKSTKVGAILVGPDHSVLGTGFNGFPRGVNDDIDDRYQRPNKLLFTSHAELNIITNAARNGIRTLGCMLYINSMPDALLPCADCARAIIQAGIVEVVCGSLVVPERWKESMNAGMEMFREAGIIVRAYPDLH